MVYWVCFVIVIIKAKINLHNKLFKHYLNYSFGWTYIKLSNNSDGKGYTLTDIKFCLFSVSFFFFIKWYDYKWSGKFFTTRAQFLQSLSFPVWTTFPSIRHLGFVSWNILSKFWFDNSYSNHFKLEVVPNRKFRFCFYMYIYCLIFVYIQLL